MNMISIILQSARSLEGEIIYLKFAPALGKFRANSLDSTSRQQSTIISRRLLIMVSTQSPIQHPTMTPISCACKFLLAFTRNSFCRPLQRIQQHTFRCLLICSALTSDPQTLHGWDTNRRPPIRVAQFNTAPQLGLSTIPYMKHSWAGTAMTTTVGRPSHVVPYRRSKWSLLAP